MWPDLQETADLVTFVKESLLKISFLVQCHEFAWDRLFVSKKVNGIILLVNKTVINILSNYIPFKIVFCDDRDPLWMTKKLEN